MKLENVVQRSLLDPSVHSLRQVQLSASPKFKPRTLNPHP